MSTLTNEQRRYRNGRALGLGMMFMFALIFFAALFASVCACGQESNATASISNAKQTLMALTLYSADHDGVFPPADQWQSLTEQYIDTKSQKAIKPSTKYQVQVPKGSQPQQFALNSAVGGIQESSVAEPDKTVAEFESIFTTRNAHGTIGAAASFPGQDRSIVGLISGSASMKKTSALDTYIWQLKR